VFAIFGFFLLIVINKWSAHSTSVDLLTIGVFIAAAYKIIPGIVRILNSAGQMKAYEFILDELKPVVDKTSKDGANPHNITSISFDKVQFKYNGQPVLNNATLDIRPGDFVGLSGSSGRGKTTLINILLGFLDQQEGIVSINNKIVNNTDRKQYWNKISYIRQQPFFVYDTLVKNITLQDDGFDLARLNDVISFCGIDTFLAQHPEYENLVITENGKNLSGGQRQRVMLARALYHGFDLLILDEPFGELDQESENVILEKLQELAAGGKMILLVTHNAQSMSYCNKIISLHEQG
jgi:ABC-type bacteriocin/lantibiotic exporter with double-glycine peptidase domain